MEGLKQMGEKSTLKAKSWEIWDRLSASGKLCVVSCVSISLRVFRSPRSSFFIWFKHFICWCCLSRVIYLCCPFYFVDTELLDVILKTLQVTIKLAELFSYPSNINDCPPCFLLCSGYGNLRFHVCNFPFATWNCVLILVNLFFLLHVC